MEILIIGLILIGLFIYAGGTMFGWNTELKKKDVELLIKIFCCFPLNILKAIYNMETPVKRKRRLLTKEETAKRFDDYFSNWKKALREEEKELIK